MNGIQDNGEVGLDGIRVELYRDNGDNIADPNTDILEEFTITAIKTHNVQCCLWSNYWSVIHFLTHLVCHFFIAITEDSSFNVVFIEKLC